MSIATFDKDMDGSMVPEKNGRWCRFEDHLAAMAEAEKILQGTKDVDLAEIQALNSALEAERGKARKWEPIKTAPMDGKRMLYLARFEGPVLKELGYDGAWEFLETHDYDGEPIYGWASDCGVPDEPTHWAYQDEGPPPSPASGGSCWSTQGV
jgi:hypothetical protein